MGGTRAGQGDTELSSCLPFSTLGVLWVCGAPGIYT